MCLPRPPATSPVARGGWAAKSINPEVVRPKISNLASCVHGWNARATAREVPLRQMHELQEKEGQMRHAEGQGEEERARAARLRNQPGCLPRAVGAGGRGVCRAHRKHEISTSPRSTRGTRGAPGARQSRAARRACIQKQRAAQIRHLKQQLNEYMQVHLFALLLICSCSRSLSVCICSQLLWRASGRKPGGSSCARRRFLCSIAGKEQGQQEQEGQQEQQQ